MNTKTSTPILKIEVCEEEYEVIGQGEMIEVPCQIGDWWVIPAQDYKGKIPPEAQKKLYDFIRSGVEIKGLLVADDMRDVKARKEKEEQEKREERERLAKRNEEPSHQTTSSVGDFFSIFFTILFLPFLILDPMIIAVLSDGRWICIASWYE